MVRYRLWQRSAVPLPGSFVRLLVASAASRFGDALIPIALAFAVLEESGSVAVLGVVLIASRAPMAAMLPMAGVLADRYSPVTVMVGADVVRCVLQGVTAWMVLTGHVDIAVLCVLQIVSGVAGAAFEPASQAVLPRLVDRDRLRQANGALTSARNLVGILAQPVAATLVVVSSSGWAFALDAVTFVVSGVAVWSVRSLVGPAAAGAGESFRRQLAGGWAFVRERSWLLRLIGFTAAVNVVGIAPFLVLGPTLAHRQGGGAVTWGVAATSFAIGAVAGGLTAMRVEPPRPVRTSVLSALAICPLFVAFALAMPAWLLAPLAALAGAQTSVLNTYSTTTIQRRTPADYLGRVMSFVFFGSMVLLPAGLGLAGAAGDLIGPESALLASAAAIVLCVVLTARTTDLDEPTTATTPDNEPAPEPATEH